MQLPTRLSLQPLYSKIYSTKCQMSRKIIFITQTIYKEGLAETDPGGIPYYKTNAFF